MQKIYRWIIVTLPIICHLLQKLFNNHHSYNHGNTFRVGRIQPIPYRHAKVWHLYATRVIWKQILSRPPPEEV